MRIEAVLLAWAVSQADSAGPKDCFKRAVGPLQKVFRRWADPKVSSPYSTDAREGLQILETNCRLCPHADNCKMAARLKAAA